MYFKIIFLCSFLTSVAFAQDAKVVKLFEENYFSKSMYVGSHCNSNIHRFIKLIHENKMDLKKFKVLYILNKVKDEFQLVVPNQKLGRYPVPGWGFHVVLLNQNYIYDFDYLGRPQAEEAHTYFRDFLVSSFQLRVIPATEFLAEYRMELNKGYFFGEINGHKYPLRTMNSVIGM